jgi:flagellar hook assembly protein FlgD
VTVSIYDVIGRLVTVLVDRDFEKGRFKTRWDGKNRNGESVESGVYFARMRAGSHTAVRKMVLLH